MPLCRPGELSALWARHGVRDVTEQPITVDTTFPSFDDYWTTFLGGIGPAGAFLQGVPEETRVAIRDRLRERLGEGEIPLTATAWMVRGRR
jgi:hypothetical protein